MSYPDFDAILDRCINRMQQGESLASCLADYPEQADALLPILNVSADLFALPPLAASPQAVQSGWEQMMTALADEKRAPKQQYWWLLWLQKLIYPASRQDKISRKVVLRTAALFLVTFILGGSLVISTSSDSLPGDWLYPVKRGWETTQFTFNSNESSRQTFQAELDERRRQEVREVLTLKRSVMVTFNGRITTQTDKEWLIENIKVQLTKDTILADVSVGSYVTIRAQVQADETLVALEIFEDKRPHLPTPYPTLTPTSEPTSTLLPTPTPTIAARQQVEATDVPAATATPSPTAEPTATHRPVEPTATHIPTHPPTATHQPVEPTATHRPAHEPTATHPPVDPTATHRPTHPPTATHRPVDPTHEPTTTPIPTHVPTPEPTATPTPTHEPTATHIPPHPPTPTRPHDHQPTVTHEPTATPQRDHPTATHEPTATHPGDGH